MINSILVSIAFFCCSNNFKNWFGFGTNKICPTVVMLMKATKIIGVLKKYTMEK